MGVVHLNSPTPGDDALPSRLLDTLLPLHVRLDCAGQITSAGPTFRKLAGQEPLTDTSLFDVLSVKRPAGVVDMPALKAHEGDMLKVQMNNLPDCTLKGVVAMAPDGGVILDLSLAASVMEVVNRLGLSNADFSPADPTVEMIYMIEVQSFMYQQHKEQSHRLQGYRVHAEEQAFTDALTGLANRRALENHLARLLRRSKGNGLALMQIDLDFFKAVNDTHGHAAGDYVLQETAKILTHQMRATDLVARIGGDEFVIVMSEYGDEEGLSKAGHRIIEKVRQPIHFEGVECRIGASIGATIVEQGSGRTPEEILNDADKALYVSKEQGRGLYNLDRDLAAKADTVSPQ